MNQTVELIREYYYPKWNSSCYVLKLLKPIGQHTILTPAGEFAQIIVETGIIYTVYLWKRMSP